MGVGVGGCSCGCARACACVGGGGAGVLRPYTPPCAMPSPACPPSPGASRSDGGTATHRAAPAPRAARQEHLLEAQDLGAQGGVVRGGVGAVGGGVLAPVCARMLTCTRATVPACPSTRPPCPHPPPTPTHPTPPLRCTCCCWPSSLASQSRQVRQAGRQAGWRGVGVGWGENPHLGRLLDGSVLLSSPLARLID